MKGASGRVTAEIKDFTGGQVTRPPQKGIDSKYSIDCQNVYSEGLVLRRRDGFTVLNATAGVGTGNGFYNWVKNASDQKLITYFGTNLAKMDVVSSAWDGMMDAISPDSAHGTAFTNGIMHFVTYNGTLIMTTENRDKPQFMRVNDTSHFDIETNGAGTGPYAKYCQVWKNHLWLLNLGGGSNLNEECSSITSWTDNDIGTGASTQTAFDGQSTFRILGGTVNGDIAKRTKDIGIISDNYSFEIKTYFDTLNTIANGDYAEVNLYNGATLFKTRFSDDGLEIFDGTSWNSVGSSIVSEDSWITWKFLLTAGTGSAAKVDVFKNDSPAGLQFSCANVSTVSNGQIDLFARAAASGTRADYYIDYMYVNPIAAVTNYLQNPQFETWLPLNGSCASFSTASGSYLQLSDSTAFNLAGNSFTIECKLYRAEQNTAAVGLYTQSSDTANQIKWHILNDNMIFSSVSSGSVVAYHYTTGLNWGLNQWYDVALVRDGTALYMFRDGYNQTLSKTTSLGGNSLPDLSTNIYIGAVAGTLGKFNGSIDEYRVSSTARYSSIGYNVTTANFTSDSSTVLLLHLDSNFTDSSSNANSITTANGVANTTGPLQVSTWHWNTAPTIAREASIIKQGTYSLKFTGGGQLYQSISIPTALAGTSTYIAGWIKPPASADYQLFVQDTSGYYYSPTLTANTGGNWEYRYFQFNTLSDTTNITVYFYTANTTTFYFDSFAVIPAGTTAVSSDYSDRLQRTAVGFYNDFTGTDSGTNDIITSGDVGLTGSFILNDRMYVTKAWSIHRLSYTQSFPLIDIKQVKKTVGTKSPRSIKNIDTPEGEIVIFLGTDLRLYLFDGITSTPISDEMTTNNGLSSVYFNNINAAALDKVHAIVHKDLNHYELFVAIGTATLPNYSIVYDYAIKSFWPWSNRSFSCGDISDNGAGLRVTYALSNSNGGINLLNTGNSDNGSAIDSYWTSTRIGNSLKLNRIDEIDVETPVQTAAPTFSWRGDWESTYITKSISSGTNSHSYAPGRIDNLIQFKVADNTTTAAWKLWTINLTERLIGVGK